MLGQRSRYSDRATNRATAESALENFVFFTDFATAQIDSVRHTANRQTYGTEILSFQQDVLCGGSNGFSVPQFNTTLQETNSRLA
jgi:hypothetical protein